MNENEMLNIRRLAMTAWLSARGGLIQVADKLQLTPQVKWQISCLLTGRVFEHHAVRNLEHALSMPANYLDIPPEGFETIDQRLHRDDLKVTSNTATPDTLEYGTGLHIQISNTDDFEYQNEVIPAFKQLGNIYTTHGTSWKIPPLQVSRQWVIENISNFECVKDFCIITEYVKKNRKSVASAK